MADPGGDWSGGFAVVHEVGHAVTVWACGTPLARYAYRTATPQDECPMPYLHPVRTLAGDVVTGHRPHDHRWHKGLSMTASHLSGQNFWGGGTYVPGAPGHGYLNLPNVGSIEHRRFTELTEPTGDSGPSGPSGPHGPHGAVVRLVEELDWRARSGQNWLDERRTLVFCDLDPTGGSWALDITTELANVRGEPLEFASPTVLGRELAGYCGLFWRGPRSFTDGEVFTSDGDRGDAAMGRPGAWLAYVGAHDEVDRGATLLFLDGPGNAVPTRWFVRTTPYAVVNPSLAFFDPVALPPGEVLRLRYRVVVADSAWDRDRVDAYVREHQW